MAVKLFVPQILLIALPGPSWTGGIGTQLSVTLYTEWPRVLDQI